MKNIFSKNIYAYISIFIFLVANICNATNMFDKMITYDSEMSDFYDTQLNCQIFSVMHNPEAIMLLIEDGEDLVHRNRYGETSLHYMVIANSMNSNYFRPNILQSIIDRYKKLNRTMENDIVNVTNDLTGMTPIFYATNPETAEVLMKNGADVEIKDFEGNTAYDYVFEFIEQPLILEEIDNTGPNIELFPNDPLMRRTRCIETLKVIDPARFEKDRLSFDFE